MLYLITGGTGWLGKRLVRALTQGAPEMGEMGRGGQEVRVLCRPNDDVADLTSLGADVLFGDVREPCAAKRLCAGGEGAVLLHLAGVIHPRRSISEFTSVNVGGTHNVVEA